VGFEESFVLAVEGLGHLVSVIPSAVSNVETVTTEMDKDLRLRLLEDGSLDMFAFTRLLRHQHQRLGDPLYFFPVYDGEADFVLVEGVLEDDFVDGREVCID